MVRAATGRRRAQARVARPTPADLVAFLADRVPRWWLPDQWTFIDEVPKTSVGKFDKKVMRPPTPTATYKVQTTPLPK